MAGILIAVVAAALALLSNTAVYYSTRSRSRLADRLQTAEQRLDTCEAERGRLRRNEQVVIASLIGLLDQQQRIELLQSIDRNVEPAGSG